MRKLGIIAGGGTLPGEVVKACQKQKRPFFVIALKGFCEADLLPKNIPVQWVRMGAVGTIEKALRREKVQDIMMIGPVRRPSIWEVWPDIRGIYLLGSVMLARHGDDGLLKAIIRKIEILGFHVIGIQEVMPEVIVRKGVYGSRQPTKSDWKDITRGFGVAKALGAVDVGQGCIVQQGLVLAVEGIEGTDRMIKRSKELRRKGGGGVLVKVKKPLQEGRVDLPTIGSRTVREAHEAGLKGIAAEVGSSIIADSSEALKLANKLGIFIVGVEEKDFKK